MTAEAMSSLPFQTGGAVAAAVGRATLWAAGIYLRQPLRNSGLVALACLSLLAGSNALYFQQHRHRAPLFGITEVATIDEPEPARPAQRTRQKVASVQAVEPVDTATTASIGNSEVTEVQQKLKALGLFDATIDGLYGPRTAKAIRAFEASIGIKQSGQLTRPIIERILAAPIVVPAPALTPVAPPAPAPVAAAPVQAEPLATLAPPPLAANPLPAPEPLEGGDTASLPPIDAASTDTQSTGNVQTLPMNSPSTQVTTRTVQTVAIRASTAAAPAAETASPLQPIPPALAPAQVPAAGTSDDAGNDPDIVSKVQRGLASLGYLHGIIDGVAGEATAKAIRNFEVYYNYKVTGRITRDLLNLLVQNGAQI